MNYKNLIRVFSILVLSLLLFPFCAFADTDNSSKDMTGVIIVGDSRVAGMQSAFTHANVFYVSDSNGTWAWYKDTGHAKVKELISSKTEVKAWKVVYNIGVADLLVSDSNTVIADIQTYVPTLLGEITNAELYFMNVTPINDKIYSAYKVAELGESSGHIASNDNIKTYNSAMVNLYSWKGILDLSSAVTDAMIEKADTEKGVNYDSDTYKKLAQEAVTKTGVKLETEEGKDKDSKDTDTAIKNVLNSYATNEDDLPGMDKAQDWGSDTPELPDGSDLTQDESLQLNKWKSDVKDNQDSGVISFFRTAVVFVGIALVVYSVFLYMAYWLDRVNNFVDMSFLGMLTLGMLSVSPDESESTFSSGKKGLKTVVHSDMVKVLILCLTGGILLISGKLFVLLGFLVDKLVSLVSLF